MKVNDRFAKVDESDRRRRPEQVDYRLRGAPGTFELVLNSPVSRDANHRVFLPVGPNSADNTRMMPGGATGPPSGGPGTIGRAPAPGATSGGVGPPLGQRIGGGAQESGPLATAHHSGGLGGALGGGGFRGSVGGGPSAPLQGLRLGGGGPGGVAGGGAEGGRPSLVAPHGPVPAAASALVCGAGGSGAEGFRRLAGGTAPGSAAAVNAMAAQAQAAAGLATTGRFGGAGQAHGGGQAVAPAPGPVGK